MRIAALVLLGFCSACSSAEVLESGSTGEGEHKADEPAAPTTPTTPTTPTPDASPMVTPPAPDGGAPMPSPDAALATTGVWRPGPGTSWQWQLTGAIDTTLAVAMYDVDLFDAPDAVLTSLRARNVKIVCYFSAGSREDWRDDAADFPAATLGNPLDGWAGERWLDIRSTAVRDVMRARLDLARTRGCDGVEPDNVDAYSNGSGFPLTAAHQLDYNRFLAREAHARGLSVGLKNDLDQIPALVSDFDWALVEECAQYNECDALLPFIQQGKAVFQVEYGGAPLATQVCPAANARQFDTLVKRLDLDAWRIACR